MPSGKVNGSLVPDGWARFGVGEDVALFLVLFVLALVVLLASLGVLALRGPEGPGLLGRLRGTEAQ